ncbi:DUF2461 domain-containing protein [uncultured Hymenobacter sp.]|uniref:DUF2461 domain-containing protein n=1 Tax=uncultured Hymenobacter sp. TaxID=170016 RepID=UPI0035CC9C07
MRLPKLFDYLRQLARHNERDWFLPRKATYDELRADFEQDVAFWLTELIQTDPALAGLTARKCLFRIYRDVRFSKNKDPYKTHFSAFFASASRVPGQEQPGYYVQLGPNNQTLIGGGLFAPDKEQLARIRQEIDYSAPALHQLLAAPAFRQFYPQGLSGERLKRVPQGYEATHPEAELLKVKSCIASQSRPDAEVLALPDYRAHVLEGLRALHPLVGWLREVG